MGYYINVPSPANLLQKYEYLLAEYDALAIPWPRDFEEWSPKKGYGLVCVVQSGPFEAAAFVYNEAEFREFTRPDDPRPKRWLVMKLQTAEELSGFKR